jgi:hypothetical protein
MRIRKKIKVSKIGKAIAFSTSTTAETRVGRMYDVSLQYRDFRTSLQIFSVVHRAKDILKYLKKKDICDVLSGNIDYYNSNDMDCPYFSNGYFEFIVKKEEQEQEQE